MPVKVTRNLKQTPIPVVGSRLQLTNPDGTITRSGQLLLEQLQEVDAGEAVSKTIVGYAINDATAGTNVAPLLVSPGDGSVSSCVVVVKASDSTVNLKFDILKNGTSVFSALPTVAAGAAAFSKHSVGTLHATPFPLATGDVFSINITTGSSNWAFTAELEQ